MNNNSHMECEEIEMDIWLKDTKCLYNKAVKYG